MERESWMMKDMSFDWRNSVLFLIGRNIGELTRVRYGYVRLN